MLLNQSEGVIIKRQHEDGIFGAVRYAGGSGGHVGSVLRSHGFRFGKHTPLGVIMPSMVAAFEFGDHGFIGGCPHETPSQHGGFGSGVADHGQLGTGDTVNQPPGKFHLPGVWHAIAHSYFTLLMQCVQNRLRAVPQHVHAKRHGAVDIAVAVNIPNISAVAALNIHGVGLHFARPAHQATRDQAFGLLPVFA